MLEPDQVFQCYELVLTVAGPNYRDEIVLRDEDLAGLEPVFRDQNGLTYERYQGRSQLVDGEPCDGAREWVEVRFDYIVSRKLEIIYESPKPEPAPVDLDGAIDQPAEVRIRPEED